MRRPIWPACNNPQRPELSTEREHRNRTLAALLTACAAGDHSAFARLYQLTSPNLYAVTLRILKQEERAQECLQDAYINVWRRADAYDATKSAPMTWLVSIVRNRALDLLRQRRPEVHLDEQAELENSVSAGLEGRTDRSMGEDSDFSRALAHCLAALQAQQRVCVELAYYEGLTHPELAARLQAPLGSVKTWIRRGLMQLRDCLNGTEYEDGAA